MFNGLLNHSGFFIAKVHRVFVADEPEPRSPPFGQGNLKGVVSLVDGKFFIAHFVVEPN
jgi:hypothetical protein